MTGLLKCHTFFAAVVDVVVVAVVAVAVVAVVAVVDVCNDGDKGKISLT